MDEVTWVSIIQVIILIIYIIGTVVVRRTQKSEIDRLKSITNTMETYMSIFNINEVKEYAEMRDELAKSKAIDHASEFIKNHDELQKLVQSALDQAKVEVGGEYLGRIQELALFAATVLRPVPEPDRTRIIKESFPISHELVSTLTKGPDET